MVSSLFEENIIERNRKQYSINQSDDMKIEIGLKFNFFFESVFCSYDELSKCFAIYYFLNAMILSNNVPGEMAISITMFVFLNVTVHKLRLVG